VTALRAREAKFVLLGNDVRRLDSWDGDFNVLIHLAAATSVAFASDPGRAFSVNLGGVLNVLEACRQRNASMVFPSTCGVYRPLDTGPVSEDHPVEGRTPYAASKLMGEMLCQSYASHYGVPCCVLRFFNVYGGGQQEPFLVPYIIRSALEGSPAAIKHPDSARDFVHVDDVVDALLGAAVSINSGCTVLNIGSGETHSVSEVIDLIGKIGGRAVKWTHEMGPEDSHQAVWADIRRAGKYLRWAPKVDLRRGLIETMEYFTGGDRADARRARKSRDRHD